MVCAKRIQLGYHPFVELADGSFIRVRPIVVLDVVLPEIGFTMLPAMRSGCFESGSKKI